MEPLDLSQRPPRSCRDELDGLILMPRTIDKLRALQPGGNANGYFINGAMPGISGYLLQLLGIDEDELREEVHRASDESEIAVWLRSRVDVARYPEINASIARVRPKHAGDPVLFANIYADTLAAHPELERIIDIVDADDRRMFARHGA